MKNENCEFLAFFVSFRVQMDEVEKELKATYKGYKDKPMTHSGYNDEWAKFWKKRYKELRSGNNFRIKINCNRKI